MEFDVATRLAAAEMDWIVPRWPAARSVQAFVTTRNGGVSLGLRNSLDAGGSMPPSDLDEALAILENRRRIEAFLPARARWLDQVHGADVVTVDATTADEADAPLPRADAAVTRMADVVLAVRIADCMPVLLSDRAGSVLGIAHAGWRGLAAGVLENTVAAMQCAPSNVVAWLGPAIGQSAFEVGADVYHAFVDVDAGAQRAFIPHRSGKWRADLEALARRRLARAGVATVTACGLCTASDAARFHSFRRDRTPARMAAVIWRTP